jgi:ATP-dependent Clp protease ATP-binding subunit ClpA
MLTQELQTTLRNAADEAVRRRHEFVTLEHLLYALLADRLAAQTVVNCGGDIDSLRVELEKFFADQMSQLPLGTKQVPELTTTFQNVLQYAILQADGSGQKEVNGANVLAALFHADKSYAVFLLHTQDISRLDVLNFISHGISKIAGTGDFTPGSEGVPDDDSAGVKSDPLAAYTTELVARAAEGHIDTLIGRTAEVERTIQILCRRRKNNPIYVGEPGVGKTAIAEGLALKIHLGQVPEVLRDARIYALDMGATIAGTKYRGEFEQRFKAIINALVQMPGAILFIDEIHTIVGAGSVQGGSMDASNILKPALASGDLRCIGSTTFSEYKASFERDRALGRRFQKIEVTEPSVAETVEILHGLKGYYEKHHGIRYTNEALRIAAELSAKYLNDRFLPDKAIDVIDEAGAAVNLLPLEKRPKTIRAKEVETVIARMARIPPKAVAKSERDRLRDLDEALRRVIFGQDHAITQVVNAIKLARSGLGQPEKPVGSFLFSGPTGVGKTELAKQLAASLGVEFIRFDMSEYAEAHTVSRLIGAPPGYVGFDQGGLLTDAITRHPYSVLVLDEIEKAHPNLYNILLQVMDHATLTDNNGKKADFRNVIIIMTTNVGARDLSEGGIGFQGRTGRGKGKGAIERTFSPEFRNRLDAWVAFDALDLAVIKLVVDKFVGELNEQLAERKTSVELTEEAREWMAQKGFDPLNGARPMRRLIQQKIKAPLAEELLFGIVLPHQPVTVDIENDDIVLRFPRADETEH